TTIIGKGGLSSKVANSFASRCFYLAFPGGCGILAKDRIEGVLDVYTRSSASQKQFGSFKCETSAHCW
ncbi:MAG TPA: hypothetical protein VF393_08235, partial [archaeon]